MKENYTDDIIKDLEKLIDNDSVYFLITKTDIKKIINKYNSLERYLSQKYKLDYYDVNEGFGLILNGTVEFNSVDFINDIKKRYDTEVEIECIGIYESLKEVELYFKFL